MRCLAIAFLTTFFLAGCSKWDAKPPLETTAGQTAPAIPDAVVRAELSLSTSQLASDLMAKYSTKALAEGETPWVNEHLHVAKKSIEQKLVDFVVTPFKAGGCLIKNVPGQCVKRVWESCVKKLQFWKCLGGWVNVQFGCVVDVKECWPEIMEVIESRLTPVEIIKDELAPTELRLRYAANLTSATIEALDGGIKLDSGVRLNLSLDLRQGLLGEDITVKGALACSSDFKVRATAKTVINPGPVIDITITDFGFDADKVCIPGAVELTEIALANPGTYITKELLGPIIKKVVIEQLNKQLDENLSDDLDLTGKLTKLAGNIREPIKLGNDNLWLLVKPRKAFVSQFKAEGTGDANRLVERVAIIASPEVLYGPKPAPSGAVDPFPVEIGDDIGREFSLVATGAIPLNDASALLKTAIDKALNEKYPQAPLVLEKARLYQSGEQFVVALTWMKRSGGASLGTIYLSATPVLDKDSRTVRLANVKLDIDSRRVLLKAADWLLSGLLETVIEHEAHFAYGGLLKEVEKAAGERPLDSNDSAALATDAISVKASGEYRHESKDMILTGKLGSVDVASIWIADDAIRVSAIAKGRLDLNFRPRF